ncbi:defensin-like protein 4 [Capsella rubella]|uniref:defensin-like protein 4 n=1 Tax=Capsella rubella TaxID=81985 RepID=UPI000CD4FFC5|nr:defensin-like protein 4 [Capsella rubella]
MAMATKLVSTLVIFLVLALAINEVPGTEAHNDECLKEYGGNVGFPFCAPRIFPSVCYSRCQRDKNAQGGKCVWGDSGVTCFCDFCSDQPSISII